MSTVRKIANTNELQTELQQILAYAQSELPSRQRIASALHSLSERVAASDADTVLDKVERQLKSKFPKLHFERFVEEEIGLGLSIEPKDREPDSSVVNVHVSEDGDSSGVSAHHYGSGSSRSEGPDFNGADASKLTAAAIKLIEKHLTVKTAGKMDDIAPGLKGMAVRQIAAANKFIEYCQKTAKLNKSDSEKVLAYYLKHKLMKLDPVTGDFKVKHGAYLDADVLQRAVDA